MTPVTVATGPPEVGLLDDLIGDGKQRDRYFDAQSPRRAEVNDQSEPGRALHRKSRRIGAVQDAAHIFPAATEKVEADALSPAEVLDALQGEPSWIVWAIWRAAGWSWAHKVLRGLPPNVRYDLQTWQRQRSEVSPAITQFLVHALARRISARGSEVREISRFERILRRFTRRAA